MILAQFILICLIQITNKRITHIYLRVNIAVFVSAFLITTDKVLITSIKRSILIC